MAESRAREIPVALVALRLPDEGKPGLLDGGKGDWLEVRISRARRAHACSSCGGRIGPGELYVAAKGHNFHRDYFNDKFCLPCACRAILEGLLWRGEGIGPWTERTGCHFAGASAPYVLTRMAELGFSLVVLEAGQGQKGAEGNLVAVRVLAFDLPSEHGKDRAARSKLRTLRKRFYDNLEEIAYRTPLGWVLFHGTEELPETLRDTIEEFRRHGADIKLLTVHTDPRPLRAWASLWRARVRARLKQTAMKKMEVEAIGDKRSAKRLQRQLERLSAIMAKIDRELRRLGGTGWYWVCRLCGAWAEGLPDEPPAVMKNHLRHAHNIRFANTTWEDFRRDGVLELTDHEPEGRPLDSISKIPKSLNTSTAL